MTYDLTLTSPTYNASGKYGSSLNGGTGVTADALLGLATFTLEGWLKCGAAGGAIRVAFGTGGAGWIGHDSSGNIRAAYGNATPQTFNGAFTVTDNVWHHVALVVTPSGGTLFLDGVNLGSLGAADAPIAGNFGVRKLGTSSSFDWTGEVDEVAITTAVKYTSNFTPGPVSDGQANLRAVWHLDGNGLNTAGTGDTTAPTFVSAQVTNAAPNVIVITMSETLAASTPPASAFAVSGGRTVSAVGAPSGTTISITVDTPYTSADTITVAYTQPGANPRLQDAAFNLTDTFSAQPVTNNILANAYDSTKILFSPYNWDVQSGFAKTIHPGAYFKLVFGGGSCTLSFDMTGIEAPYPKLQYRVDKFGAWNTVDLAASIVITVPTETASYGSHFLEFYVRSVSETVNRWATQACGVKLTGIALAATKTLGAKPAASNLSILYYGDSITEGVNTITNSGDTTVRSDAQQGWAVEASRLLGAESGIVGFGGQGYIDTGPMDVPAFSSTYAYLYSGVARSFSPAPDAIVVNHGHNDNTGNTVSAATAFFNAMIAATPSSTKIIALCPFSGRQASNIQAAIAACSAPARVTYVDTAGYFTSANSSDTVHPYGWENITHIAPLVAEDIQDILDGAPTLTTRTVSITLRTAAGPAANLTGAKVALYDEPTPDLYTTARYQTAAETLDASGVLAATYGSTLASGGTGGFVIQFANGTHCNGQMTVT
jgi:hypothetical protein